MSLQFEWDPKKAEANQVKHRVSFEEAITVFADPLARIFDDDEHSGVEKREIIVGHSVPQDLLLVSFTATDDRVRILSARKATRRERKDYEENISS
jgi:uncharacterized DUF497 family protein